MAVGEKLGGLMSRNLCDVPGLAQEVNIRGWCRKGGGQSSHALNIRALRGQQGDDG